MIIAVVAVVIGSLMLALVLLHMGRGYWAWVLPGALLLVFGAVSGRLSVGLITTAAVFFALAALFGIRPLRARLVTPVLMKVVSKALPRMSETERVALEAGTVWWDGELFSGDPSWTALLTFPSHELSAKERAFLEGPVQELCAMLDEWSIEQERDLPAFVWRFIKEQRFFAMIIPESYGGLGFSATAHSAVVTKLASRSVAAAVTVMVPNSLGPAELLLRYGTEDQKRHLLPRLASGDEIPCFALTGPEAGSDAAATQSIGVVAHGMFGDREVLGMRLTWHKRYITLGPIATLIALAFRLQDPEHLLGAEDDLGITVALIPADLPGIEIGRRHDPMGVPFQNGPTSGRNVFVPLDFIIGGRARAGQGWRMLMESLAAGRGISLPALSVGGAELATRVVGAYATVREQFDTPIGRFEGIEEPLARIGGLTYVMNAARTLTVAAIDAGEHPAVLSAIVKAYLTEGMRAIVNDAMDIRAGAAIVRGPRNTLASLYLAAPLGITVEGANILTRSMIIYGQGAIRCHPYVRDEMAAARNRDVRRFDTAFFGHLRFIARNVTRLVVAGFTGGRFLARAGQGQMRTWTRELTRASCAFAVMSDAAMLILGGKLKRREKISGRLADALAWLYLGSATLKRFHQDGERGADRPFARWGVEQALYRIERALQGIVDNLPSRVGAFVLRAIIFPFGARRRPPSDRVGAEVARALLEDHEGRLRLTQDMYVPAPDEAGLGRLEAALDRAVDAIAVETKLRDALRNGWLDHAPGDELAIQAREAGLITEEELDRLRQAEEARREVIEVDAFDARQFAAPAFRPSPRAAERLAGEAGRTTRPRADVPPPSR